MRIQVKPLQRNGSLMALKRAGLKGIRKLVGTACRRKLEMLGLLLQNWFAIDVSVLQNTDNSSQFLRFDLSFSKSPQPNPMLSNFFA